MNGQRSRTFFGPRSLPHSGLQRSYLRDARVITGKPLARMSDRVLDVRSKSTLVGEDRSGHIVAHANEGIMFFDNLFPWIFRLPFLKIDHNISHILWQFNNSRFRPIQPLSHLKLAIPESAPIKVTEILPQSKDGGAFVKFSHPDGITTSEVERLVKTHLKERKIRPWYNPFRRIRTNLVQGVPWLEDLHRFPSARLKVEFLPAYPGTEASELSQESLYSLFRRYGKIAEITSQPSDSKVLPRFAYLDFALLRHSIMARNCMHGFKVLEETGKGGVGTKISLSYQPKIKAKILRDYIVGHPRIVIPIIATLLATVTVAIFDPIRTFFIKVYIEHSFHIRNLRIYQWFMNQAPNVFKFRGHASEEASLNAVWDDRKEIIDQLQKWLMETLDTFIVVQGPRGSGKKELILNQALKDRKNVLCIDCKPIQEARSDSATINAAAAEVGYRPVFSWMNSISSFIDLAAQGTIGVKSGLSETLDTQLAKIWQTTATALKQIALEGRSKKDSDIGLADDDYLEVHPERRPVVIIDNFLYRKEESGVVYDKIAEWAAGLITANIAHVIFLTNDTSYSKSLGRALPDRVFRQIILSDITPQVAKKYVLAYLNSYQDPSRGVVKGSENIDLSELDECIDVLGGRLTDLEFLARRLKTRQGSKIALQEIIEQSASEILKIFLITLDSGDRKWSTEQAWYLVKSLADNEQLRYNEVLLSNTFSSSLTPSAVNGESALDALCQAELIAIKASNGRLESIRAGKPVFRAAFKLLTEDHVLSSRLDLAILTELIKIETKSIEKYEHELSVLAHLPKIPAQVGLRIDYLLTKLSASQHKVQRWEQKSNDLKQILSTEF